MAAGPLNFQVVKILFYCKFVYLAW